SSCSSRRSAPSCAASQTGWASERTPPRPRPDPTLTRSPMPPLDPTSPPAPNGTRPRPIRTAILGYGVAGRFFHGAFLRGAPAYAVALISAGDPDRAAQARADHPSAQLVADPHEITEHAEELDLVIVATPPASHVELARLALRSGLDVVVDKPFAPTSADGAALIAEAATLGRRLSVFQTRRYDADFLTLQG